RTHRSVEFKHMNISAVLAELGLPTIRGYKAKENYQQAIFPAIGRYLSANPEVAEDEWLPREVLARADRIAAQVKDSGPQLSGLNDLSRAFRMDAPVAEQQPIVVEA